MILCAECNLQYIGCTSNVLKVRICRHLTDITNPNSGNVSAASRHLIAQHNRDLTNFRFMGIEKVWMFNTGGDRKRKLFKRESFWIFVLDTRVPMGLNIRQDLRVTRWLMDITM